MHHVAGSILCTADTMNRLGFLFCLIAFHLTVEVMRLASIVSMAKVKHLQVSADPVIKKQKVRKKIKIL